MEQIAAEIGASKETVKTLKEMLAKVGRFKPRRGKPVDLRKGAWAAGDQKVESKSKKARASV